MKTLSGSRIICASLLLVLPGCTQEITWTAERIDIVEAVFQYQIEQHSSGSTATDLRFFLSIGKPGEGEDPPAELMARFVDHSPLVAPVSDSGNVGPGTILRVEGLKRIDADTVDVDGGYYRGRLSASGNTYHVKRKDGVWVVEGDSKWWIS